MKAVERVGSVLGGGILLAYGLRRRSVGGALLSAVGTSLVVRGAAAIGPALTDAREVVVERSVTISVEPREVYEAWRSGRAPDLARVLTEGSETAEERPGERLAWRGPGHAGTVTFGRAPGGRGTEVRVVLRHAARAGALGAAVARLVGPAPASRITEELREWKQRLEAGEVPTVAGQPAGAGRMRRTA